MIREALRTNHLDAIINVTTSGTKFSEDMRVAHLPILMPEMCSYDPGTLNWANSYIFLNTPPFLERLGLLTQELDIKPEIEIFDAGMLGNVDYYLKKGVLKAPLHYQLVLDVLVVCRAILTRSTIWFPSCRRAPPGRSPESAKPHALYAGRSGRRLRQPARRSGGQRVYEEGRIRHQRPVGGAGRSSLVSWPAVRLPPAAEAREILGIKPEKGVLYQP